MRTLTKPEQRTYLRPFEGYVTHHAEEPERFRVNDYRQWFRMPQGTITPRPALGKYVTVLVTKDGTLAALRVRTPLRERIIRANRENPA